MCSSCQTSGNKLYKFRILDHTYKVCAKSADCLERRKKLMAKLWRTPETE